MPRKWMSAEPRTQRSRKGCDKCRCRKVRCDQARPICGQCSAKGFECATTINLKWETDYVGRAFGRVGVWSKNAAGKAPLKSSVNTLEHLEWCKTPRIQSYSFVNATIGALENLTASDLDIWAPPFPSQVTTSEERDDGSSTASLSPWLSERRFSCLWSPNTRLTTTPHLHHMHSELMAYYLDRLCPVTIPSSSAKSPFASLLLPFSITASPAVLDALLALAACHRSKSDVSYRASAIRLGDQALQTLRTRLARENHSQVAFDPETVVVMMLLCQYEIINECDKRWVVHLKGARDLIRFRRRAACAPQQTSSENDLVAFSERFFAFQDVIGRTACGEESVFGHDFWSAEVDETDSWLGCSPALVRIICEITELSRQHRVDPAISCCQDFQVQAACLKRRVASIQQRILDEDDSLLETAAEVKRTAAELYLHCALYGASPAMPHVQHYVQQILRLIFLLLNHNILAGLAWPIFVAAVALNPVEDANWCYKDDCPIDVPIHMRPFILYALDRMKESTANVSRTRFVILQVWQARESEEYSCASRSEFDWERFVAPFCVNMSLA